MNRSSKYDVMQQEYVMQGVSIRSLAKKHDRAYSTIARMSRIQNWKDKRSSYLETLNGRVYDATADTYAERMVKIHDKFLDAADKALDLFIKDVEQEKIHPVPQDVVKLLEFARKIAGEPDDRREEKIVGLFGHFQVDSADAARSIESIARGRLGPSPVATTARVVTGGAG